MMIGYLLLGTVKNQLSVVHTHMEQDAVEETAKRCLEFKLPMWSFGYDGPLLRLFPGHTGTLSSPSSLIVTLFPGGCSPVWVDRKGVEQTRITEPEVLFVHGLIKLG
jgi:hypothetical protein